MPNQKIELIDAIAIARGTEEPTNRDVFWLDKSLTGGFYDRLKSYNYDTEKWELVSRSNQEILSDLRTVDGAGSGLDSDTLQGYTPDQLISQGASGLPAMSTGKIIVGQGDTIGQAKTLGGIATIDANGSMAYVTNSISHTGLTDVGTNTHVQIDSHIADSAIHLSAAQSTKLGHISVTQAVDLDQMETDITANNAKPTNNLATGNLTQAAAARTYNMNSQDLLFTDGFLKVTEAGTGDMFYLEQGGGDITFGGASGVGTGGSNWIHQTNFNTASSTVWEHRDFGNNTGLKFVNWTTTGGLNHYATLEYGGSGIMYILQNGGGAIQMGSSTTINVGYGTGAQRPETVRLIAGAGQFEVSGTSGGTGATTFTDNSSTTAGIEYAADYSSDFTARSLVDKAYVDANAGGSNFANADLQLTGDRNHELNSNKLIFRCKLTANADRIESFYDNNPVGGMVVDHYDKFGTKMHSINRDSFENLAYAVGYFRAGMDVGPKSAIKMRGFSGTGSYIKFSNQFGDPYSQIGANMPHYFLAASGALATNKFIVGENSAVGSESISLQGSTLIKGEGTSTGSTLALYDNDTTPYKRFEILDNGQFRLDSSNAVVATPFKIEMRPLGGTGTPPYFMIKNYGEVEIYGGLSNLFNVQNTLGAKQFEVLNGTTKINGASQINSTWFQVLTDTQKMSFNAGSGGALHHEIRTNGGGGPITTKFNIPGGGYQFIVGASAIIGTEKISLQGSTLIKGTDTLSTSSALQVYDGDSTPNLLVDFKNSGNVDINANWRANEGTLKINSNNQSFVGMGLTDTTNGYYGGFFWRPTTQYLTIGSNTSGFAIEPTANNQDFVFTSSSFTSENELIVNDDFTLNGNQEVNANWVASKGTININSSNQSFNGFGLTDTATGYMGFFGYRPTNDYFVIESTSAISGISFNTNGNNRRMTITDNGLNISNLPTSSAGLSSGDVYNDSGTLKIV